MTRKGSDFVKLVASPGYKTNLKLVSDTKRNFKRSQSVITLSLLQFYCPGQALTK